MPNRLAGKLTVPAPAQDNPVDWYAWGEEALERSPRTGPAAARLDRLLGVPLVPRDGARVLRGPGDRGVDERALRVREGRPRGAPRRRRGLHGGLPGDDRPGRLAAERVSDPRVPCPSTQAPTFHPSRGRDAELGDGARAVGDAWVQRRDKIRQQRGRDRPLARGERTARAVGRADSRSTGTPRRSPRCAAHDRSTGGFGGAPKFPQASVIELLLTRGEREMSLRTLRRWPRAGSTTRSAAASRATRSTPPGRSPTSRRCSTTTRCWRAPTSTVAGLGQRALPAGVPRDARLGAARDARPRRRLLLGARRRLRGRRGQVLRLDARGASPGARALAGRSAAFAYFGASERGNFERGLNVARGAGARAPGAG